MGQISERMSKVDTAWLRMDTEANLMMIVGVWSIRPGITLAALRERVAERLLKYPRFRQKVVEDSLVGFLEQSSRFLKPVFADDTIYPALEVTELVPGRTTGAVTLKSTVFNQRKELVLEGVQKFLIRRRPTG